MNEFCYKILDQMGNFKGILTCNNLLPETETQIQIIKAEYDMLYEELYQNTNINNSEEGE